LQPPKEAREAEKRGSAEISNVPVLIGMLRNRQQQIMRVKYTT